MSEVGLQDGFVVQLVLRQKQAASGAAAGAAAPVEGAPAAGAGAGAAGAPVLAIPLALVCVVYVLRCVSLDAISC